MMFNVQCAVVTCLAMLAPMAAFSQQEESSNTENSALMSDVIMRRHSGTEFEPTPVPDDQVQALVQAARWSPSSFNDQAWNFIFCDRFTQPEAHAKVVDSIYGQEWVEDAPLLVVAVVRPNFLYNGKENDWAEYDTGAAAMSMSLQATDLGLMAHQIGGFDPEQIQEDFAIPEEFYPLTVIAIGYEAGSAEETPRERRPIAENFFMGEWGAPLLIGEEDPE
jgi:nitroreductase